MIDLNHLMNYQILIHFNNKIASNRLIFITVYKCQISQFFVIFWLKNHFTILLYLLYRV